jgi:hypothetical protein
MEPCGRSPRLGHETREASVITYVEIFCVSDITLSI